MKAGLFISMFTIEEKERIGSVYMSTGVVDLRAVVDGIDEPFDRYTVVRWRRGTIAEVADEAGLEHLKVAKRELPDWFRYPVNATSGAVVAPTLLFLAKRCFACRKRHRNTHEALVYDLRAWLEFLSTEGRCWDEADQTLFDEYVLDMAGDTYSEESEDLSLARKTITRRVSTLKAFYADARSRGSTVADFSTKLAGSIGRSPESAVRPFSPEDLKLMLPRCGPRPTDRVPGQTSRLWLATMVALLAGLRLFEVCALDCSQIEETTPDGEHPMTDHAVKIVVGKGGGRTVLVPAHLLLELKHYIAHERAELVERLDGRADPNALFLNHALAGPTAGGRLRPPSLARDFRNAVRHHRLVRQRPGFRHGAGSTSTLHTFHDLRHTCACLYYAAYVGRIQDPWLEVQRRLGHALAETTVKVYLAHATEFQPGANELVQASVLEMISA